MHHPHHHTGYFWERAPFFRLLIPLVGGIYCYDIYGYSGLSLSAWCIGISGCFFIYCLIACRKRSASSAIHFSYLLVNIILFGTGIVVSGLHDIRQNPNWFGNQLQRYAKYVATVAEEPKDKALSWGLRVDMVCSIKDNVVKPVTGEALVDVEKSEMPMNLHKGDTVLLPAKWTRVKNAGNPFEFDYARYCSRNNLLYSQFCSPGEVILFAKRNPATVSFLETLHNMSMARLDTFITDKDTRGLIQAMLLGDAVNLDRDLRHTYAETGIVHIIAISGSNVAFIFMTVAFLLGWLKNKRFIWIKYLMALPLVWVYVMMAGGEASAIRAAVMFSLLALGVAFEQEHSNLNTLFATSLMLLCANPAWLFSLGFQLSFTAVLSVILFFKPIYSVFHPKNKFTARLYGAIAGGLSAEILAAPVVVWYFHTFPVMFIVSNILGWLLMGASLLAGVAVVSLEWVPPLAKAVGLLITWLVTWFNRVILWLQALSPHSFDFLKLSGYELLLVYVVTASAAMFLLYRYKTTLFVALSAFCVLLTISCFSEWTRLHREVFVVYNISKTNHIEWIQGANYSVLNTDSPAISHPDDLVLPAHAAWQVWEDEQRPKTEILRVAGKTVLLLDSEINTTGQFPVDYLVVNYSARKIQPEKLARMFSPREIIIGNNFTQHRQEQWKQACMDAHVPIHTVKDDGAFVLGGVE